MNATTTSPLLRHLTPERGFDLIRIYLGIGLAVRGVLFLLNPGWIGNLLSAGDVTSLIARAIAVGHIAGGVLLGLGLFTRWAAAIQVLPVFGALVMYHSHASLAGQNQSFEFSALVLIMLVFFAFFGAGQWSLDQQRKR
jgi:uncharacterized membrane protein YphA (DoxX/SURF4 family)